MKYVLESYLYMYLLALANTATSSTANTRYMLAIGILKILCCTQVLNVSKNEIFTTIVHFVLDSTYWPYGYLHSHTYIDPHDLVNKQDPDYFPQTGVETQAKACQHVTPYTTQSYQGKHLIVEMKQGCA